MVERFLQLGRGCGVDLCAHEPVLIDIGSAKLHGAPASSVLPISQRSQFTILAENL